MNNTCFCATCVLVGSGDTLKGGKCQGKGKKSKGNWELLEVGVGWIGCPVFLNRLHWETLTCEQKCEEHVVSGSRGNRQRTFMHGLIWPLQQPCRNVMTDTEPRLQLSRIRWLGNSGRIAACGWLYVRCSWLMRQTSLCDCINGILLRLLFQTLGAFCPFVCARRAEAVSILLTWVSRVPSS